MRRHRPHPCRTAGAVPPSAQARPVLGKRRFADRIAADLALALIRSMGGHWARTRSARPDGHRRGQRSDPVAITRRGDAERFLSTITADVVRGTYVDPHDPTIFREYARPSCTARPRARTSRPTCAATPTPASATAGSRPFAPARSRLGSPP